MSPTTISRSSTLTVPAERVWAWATDFDGINHELMPWMRMRVPSRYADTTVADITPGQSLGRVWIFYLGFLPLDYDDLTIAELEPGRRFLETSSMATMRTWNHERTITPLDASSCRITDTLTFVPRLPLRPLRPLLARIVAGLFAHRHRRLVAAMDARGS